MREYTDPTSIDWPTRQAAAVIPFEVVDGRPVNPCEKTSVQRGRNGLGRWGENLAADAGASVLDELGDRWAVLVERNRGRGWGLPGGFQDLGETSVEAAPRELWEEAGLDLRDRTWRSTPPRYVRNKRASDEAWMVTVLCTVDLGTLNRNDFPRVIGQDDALRAAWVRANTYQELTADLKDVHGGEVSSANHRGMLVDWLGQARRSQSSRRGGATRPPHTSGHAGSHVRRFVKLPVRACTGSHVVPAGRAHRQRPVPNREGAHSSSATALSVDSDGEAGFQLF